MQDVTPEARGQRQMLVVAGSGRSGTSLFAGISGRLGLHIPQPEVKANDTNPRGFGEPRWAVAFHKEPLAAVDVTHDDGRPQAWDPAGVLERPEASRPRLDWLEEQFDQAARIVVKDPRLGWFLPLYQAAAARWARRPVRHDAARPGRDDAVKLNYYGGRSGTPPA